MAESRRERRRHEARQDAGPGAGPDAGVHPGQEPDPDVASGAVPTEWHRSPYGQGGSPYGASASPYVTPSAPYDVNGSAPYDVNGATSYDVSPAARPPDPDPVIPDPPRAPDHDLRPESRTPLPVHPLSASDPDGPRGEGRRISELSELRGVRRIVHVSALPGAGVLLLVWALTTIVGDVRWGPFSVLPVAFACLSPLIVVVAVPLVLVAIQRRRWAAMIPAVAAAVLPWSFVIGYALPADPLTGPTVPLRAMIVTAHDGQADAADIVDAVKSQRTDLLVVTELSPSLAHDLTGAGLPEGIVPRYVKVPDPGASPAAGIGIYSRFPIDQKHVYFLTGTHWPAIVAEVTVGRTTVTLVAGHAVQPSTDHLDRWRRDLDSFQASERLRGPVVVLVNLNATPWNPQYRRVVSGRLHDAADVLGHGLRPTWPTWSPLPLLATDHALVAGLGVTELSALSIKGSDHRALSVGLSVPTPDHAR